MRQVLCMLLFLLVTQMGYSQQGVEQLVKRFARSEQVEQVHVGRMLLTMASLFTETNGVKSVNVMDFSACGDEVRNEFQQAVKALKDPAFDMMVNHNEEGVQTRVLVRIEKECIRELVVLTTGAENALVHIKGKIQPSDIEHVMNDHKHGH